MSDLTAVVSTAVGAVTVMAAGALYVIRAENGKQAAKAQREGAAESQRLSESMVELRGAVQGLTETIKQQKVDERERHADTQEAIGAIRDVLGDHEARLRVVEQPAKSARITPSRRRS